MFYFFILKNAREVQEAHKEICDVSETNAMTERVCQNLICEISFGKFFIVSFNVFWW